ncbi:WhiB family redox-sensing transcriptional regulator [Saccharothrix ecbatanensis]|uniref:WhiB family redox-sensing transcriptional regulator n=1 Tax=Saccharothrix ecbatanensis TaxID=1105145 RepID=A0A7W9HEH1_9PSEU|nr:WhiB family transcriptional regulator [Saccharothrix ecbatanensis]MBB5800792.1 WhiB family redox-sensing transcriptional regulator [Saccharothrix ecbatanensis]
MNDFYERVAADLDGCAELADDQLAHAVRNRGLCGWLSTSGEYPEWTGDFRSDRELAARVCAACPVQRECLEWEFRTRGHATAGVWGPLPEDERRAVYECWEERRDGGTVAGEQP